MDCNDESCVLLKIDDNNLCQIHKFGGTLIRWVHKGKDRLFLSSDAVLDGSKAIRGGVPVVFPNFGPWSQGPQHGFARISWWTVSKHCQANEHGCVQAELSLSDTEETRAMWNYNFELKLTVTLSAQDLTMSLSVSNKSLTTFTFTCLLHTYLAVDDVSRTRVLGLAGSSLDDRIEGRKESVLKEDELQVKALTDSIYHGVKPNAIKVAETRNGSLLSISTTSFPDLVVWNPWQEKASGMKDLSGDQWSRMLCVEVGRVVEPVSLPAGQIFISSQTFSVV